MLPILLSCTIYIKIYNTLLLAYLSVMSSVTVTIGVTDDVTGMTSDCQILEIFKCI